MSSQFKNKNILITGGTGSFGRALAYDLLKEDACNKVIIFSRDEWKQWEMQNSDPVYSSPKARYFLGDVRDKARLQLAFRDVHYIIHAAALKQVPAAEYNPSEFVKTNIEGSMNVIDAAMNCGVEKVIALSTDKAVNPVNLYGATKLCADKLFIASNAYVGAVGKPALSIVRYGNVLGSRGSLLPYWKKLIEQGVSTLPVTHAEMTRFWITLSQAIDFVKNALGIMKGGEIFVPKIPTMKIIDIAKALAPEIKIEITGIREGEKLHELLIHSEDARYTFEFDQYYVILPPAHMKSIEVRAKALGNKGKKVLPGFEFSSDKNPLKLDVSGVRELLQS